MTTTSTTIPIIDIAPFIDPSSSTDAERTSVARAWDQAFCTTGFARIVGHGVSPALIHQFRTQAHAFFAQSHRVKMQYHRGPYGCPLGGYTAVGQEAVSRSRDGMGSDGGAAEDQKNNARGNEANDSPPPDMVESFVLRHDQMEKDPQALAQLGEAYRRDMLRVLTSLHELSATALLGSDQKDFFVPFYDTTDQHSLRLGYYPACTEESLKMQHRGAMRYGEHTDYTGFTILLQDEGDSASSTGGGLQVKLPDGTFHSVAAVPGSFVVNIGDMFQVWTNDRWKSTVHRVAAPNSPCGPRLSIPFFSGPNNAAQIAPILIEPGETAKHETITAGEHLWRKLQATQT